VTDSYRLPMFPLGTALLPGAAIPLRVFEPRYLELVDRCLNPDHPRHDGEHAGEFGVVLIERGREVGGGDIRAVVGTVARIVDAKSAGDRYHVLAVGVRRIRIVEWLDDDPHPLAVVDEWPDDDDGRSGASIEPTVDACLAEVRRIIGLSVELGDLPSDVLDRVPAELSTDPGWATYQLAALAPIGSADRHRILGGPTPADRLAILKTALEDLEMSLRFRLSK